MQIQIKQKENKLTQTQTQNSVVAELETLDPNISNAELFRTLEQRGYGSETQFNSQYWRNSFDFKDTVDNWRNGAQWTNNSDMIVSGEEYDLLDELNGSISDTWTEVDENTETNYIPMKEISLEDYLKLQRRNFNQHMRSHDKESEQVKFKVKGDWACAMIMSDLHLEDFGSNIAFLYETMGMMSQFSGIRFIELGDLGNWFTQNWSQKIALGAEYTPEQAMDAVERLFQFMGDKRLVSIVGNHEEFVSKDSGIDFIKRMSRIFAPKALYRKYDAIVQIGSDSGFTQKVLLSHAFNGKAMWNAHHATVKNLFFNYDHDINFAMSGHYHFPHTAYAEFPFEKRFLKSILLGTIKSGDSYARGMKFGSDPNSNPFVYLFQTPSGQKVITNTQHAIEECERLENLYGARG